MPFDAWYQPRKSSERIVFVGCVHKTDHNILARLAQVAANPPNYLIFTGDVTGSEELEEFKCLFYNHVYNRTRRELGIGTPAEKTLTDANLLAYVGDSPPSPDRTLKDGYLDLVFYQHRLEGNSSQETLRRAHDLSDAEIAKGIRHIASNFEYYGPWVKTLPEAVRRGVVATLRQDAEKLVAAIKPIQNTGTEVIMVGGNWDDAQNTADNMIGEGIEVFDTIPFFREHDISFYDQIGCLATQKTVLIFLPYWELAKGEETREIRFAYAITTAESARFGKTIIVVAHGAPSWQVHNPTAVDEPTGDRKTVHDTLGKLLAMIKPDEVVHGHEHNPLKKADGSPLSLNTHYVLQVDGNTVHPVDDPKRFGFSSQIIGTYIPFQKLATLDIPLECDPHPHLFGGNRDPAFVY